jgi:hypothetical protein
MKAGILALCIFAVPQIASAQTMQWTDKGYVAINGGAQIRSGNVTVTTTPQIYGEQANIATTSKIKSGGFFDLGGAYRVWGHNLLAGLSYSHTSSNSNGTINASIPDPVQFGSPRPFSSSVGSLKHSENQIHLDAIWMMPVAEKLDVGVFAGPSIFLVKQGTIGNLNVTEPGPTVTAQVGSSSKAAVGINLGADLQYMVARKIAVGGLARYSWGRAKIGSGKVTAGGFQIGGGLRYRF